MKWIDPDTGKVYRVGNMMKPRIVDKVMEGVRMGMTDVKASEYAGLSCNTVTGWRILADMKPGEEGVGYRYYIRMIDQARAEFQASLLGTVVTAATVRQNWNAAAWLLERRFSVDFASKQVSRIETSTTQGEIDSPQQTTPPIDLTALTTHELQVLYSIIQKNKQPEIIDVEPSRPQLPEPSDD